MKPSLAVALLLGSLACGAQAQGSPWRVESGDVRVVVPMRPGGAFEARTRALRGELTLTPGKPARLNGELHVELATLDTGIGLRNRHMVENYLEVSRGAAFAAAVLSQLRLDEVEDQTFEGRTGFTGVLHLHGVEKPVGGSADLKYVGAKVKVHATFQVALPDFGITPPDYMGVGVGSRVIVKVAFEATQGARR